MGGINKVFVFHEVMDETDVLGEFVCVVGKVDVSSVKAVVQYSFIEAIELSSASSDFWSRHVHHFWMNRAP